MPRRRRRCRRHSPCEPPDCNEGSAEADDPPDRDGLRIDAGREGHDLHRKLGLDYPRGIAEGL
jgi:hypothetical protein